MSVDFEIESPSGIVVLCDAAISPPIDSATTAELKERAKSGELFLIDAGTDERSHYRIRVLIEEEPSEELGKLFENAGGSFRLDAPSGTLVFSAGKPLGQFSLPPGHYLLQPMIPRQFVGEEYRARREKLFGASDARFARFVERLA